MNAKQLLQALVAELEDGNGLLGGTLEKLAGTTDPFKGEGAMKILFKRPPTLGGAFTFGGEDGNGMGNTSYVVKGTFEKTDTRATWKFETRSGSKYELVMHRPVPEAAPEGEPLN